MLRIPNLHLTLSYRILLFCIFRFRFCFDAITYCTACNWVLLSWTVLVTCITEYYCEGKHITVWCGGGCGGGCGAKSRSSPKLSPKPKRKNDRKMDPTGNKNEPKFILYPFLGNVSSPGPERVIAAGNWDQTKNLTSFALNKTRKMDPTKGPGKGQRTSFSLPKFGLGPLGHPKRRQSASRTSPGRFLTEFGPDFMIV